MRTMFSKTFVFVCLLGALAFPKTWADPPSRVARLNFIEGTVSFQPGGVDEWTAASLNYPLTIGDHLWADQGSRAELHIASTAIRLDSGTEISVLNLDDKTVQLRLSEGSLNIKLRSLDSDETFEVDTPNMSVSLLRTGTYRVDVGDDGTTRLVVRAGDAEVTAGSHVFTVRPDQSASVSGLDSSSYNISSAPGADEWDSWCMARDSSEDRIASTRYVSPYMTGYEDLDTYGTWSTDPGYGPVWTPTVVVAGWAPYHFGRWAWVDPWGWTWIDDAPWGFAPFHYGRWAHLQGRWCWLPGALASRPVYAPALVVFVGGGGWGPTMVVGGGIGWFPLGPHEAFIPGYHVSTAYVQRININNVTRFDVHNIDIAHAKYANKQVPGAVVVMPGQAFVKSEPVSRSAVSVRQSELVNAPLSGMGARLVPEKDSVLGRPAGTTGVVHAPPSRITDRPVVARTKPPRPPVPFTERQKVIASNNGQPLDQEQTARLTPGTAPSPQVRITNGVSGQPLKMTPAAPRSKDHPQGQPNTAQQMMKPAKPNTATQMQRIGQPNVTRQAPRSKNPNDLPQVSNGNPAASPGRDARIFKPAPAPAQEQQARTVDRGGNGGQKGTVERAAPKSRMVAPSNKKKRTDDDLSDNSPG